jgi:3-methyladenine DNA glycosylase AlkD
MEIVGVRVPEIRKAYRPEKKALKSEPPATVLALAEALLAAGLHEGRQAAFELIDARSDLVETLSAADLERLGRGNDNWASVDCFATGLVGQAWRRGFIEDATVAGWARSPDRWWRRTALAATVALNLASRGGEGDVPRTMAVCTMLADDADPMVSKALSWALRSVVTHDRACVDAFLERYEATVPRYVVREVRKKLDTGKKNG